MHERRIVLVDNYDSYTYNLFQLLWEISSVRPEVIVNDRGTADAVLAQGYTHVVVSPGPGSPDRAEDVGLCADLLGRARIPCLGVCLGHQVIGHAFGAQVVPAPAVMHGRSSSIRHSGTRLFAGIPQGFRAVRYHSLAVAQPLPADLSVTARSEDGVVMALEHRSRPLFGVQFHPESIGTEHGARLVANFLGVQPRATRQIVDLAGGRQRRAPPHGGQQATTRQTVQWREVHIDLSPEVIFTRLFADRPYAFWLDSARSAHDMGRYTFMGASDDGDWAVLRAGDGGQSVTLETPHGVSSSPGTLFEVLDAELADPVSAGDTPVPFIGGYAGYLGYDIKVSAGFGKASGDVLPDAELLRIDRLLAFDHVTGRAFLVDTGHDPARAPAWFDQMRTQLADLHRLAPPVRQEVADLPAGPSGPVGPPETTGPPAVRRLRDSVDRDTYRSHLAEIQRWLRAGDSYEACYTYQIEGTCDSDPYAVYLRLRAHNPAPYAAYLRFGERHVLSCSPERFVTIDGDRWVESKPIKGTAPRSPDPASDAAAARNLASEEKTRSENLMIVDLLRNDLGRVCEPGTVHVPRLMAVESYATVHQLVSTVRGRLRPDISAVSCVAALFPGGSMTGAPKRRTVELLDDLEPAPRGAYSGCLGYFGADGRADHSIVIRTVVWEGDRFSIGVGGAITALSDPDDEYAETRLKAQALLSALGADTGLPGNVTRSHDSSTS